MSFREEMGDLCLVQSNFLSQATFSSLAAISDSTAFFILCTSTSGEERKTVKESKRLHMLSTNWRV